MKIRDVVRSAILKTNPYWPFSTLNRTPYHVAIKAFVKLCEGLPEVKATYLRGRLSKGHFIPALSDIDLTVILDPAVSVDHEYQFLRSFWKRCRRMKSLFPMLGEIEILNAEEVAISTKFGLPGYQAKSWRLLYGTEMARNSYIPDPVRLRRDSLNHALWFYLEYFVEILTSQEGSPYLVSQDLRRLQSKILRCLYHLNGAKTTHTVRCKPLSANVSNAKVFSDVLNSFNQEICRFNIKNVQMATTERRTALEPSNPPSHDDGALDLSEFVCLDGAIKSVIVNSFNKIFVVLETALDEPTLKTCMETMIRVFRDKGRLPAIISAPMFEYMVRHYEPFAYVAFDADSKVLIGEDLLSNIEAPSRDAFVHYLLGRVPTLLSFPRSCAVISDYSPTPFKIRELECTVEQSLFLKLYLEKGMVQPWYDKFVKECEGHYPDHFVKLRGLKAMRDQNSSQEWFGFLRGLADDVHDSLVNAATRGDL